MANPLTGDYEAAVQIAIRQINGLLGTMHQNAATPDAALKLLHSTTLRIGDRPRRPPDVDAFGDWLIRYHKAAPGRGLRDVRARLTAVAPPGAARMLSDALAGFDRDWAVEYPPDVVRGRVKLQVSSVTVAVPDGSSSEVTVQARVRARYYPDPGTTDMPAPVHGEVRAAFDVRKVQSTSGARLLIRPSSQDSKIQFVAAPGTGLTAADESRIVAEVRKVLREGLTLLPVDLPPDFPFEDFKGLGSGPSQAIALPFQLSGAAPPANGLPSLKHSFLGSSGIALALSEEYVKGFVDIGAIRRQLERRTQEFGVRVFGRTFFVRYGFRFSSGPALNFKNGAIEIYGRVEARAVSASPGRVVNAAPNGFVEFTQLVTLVLDNSAQTVDLARAGAPDVNESWFISHDTAVSIVTSEIDNALRGNAAKIKQQFSDAKDEFVDKGLKILDPSATASYTAVEITPDGVIVHGEIGSGARRASVVHIAETHQGAAFTAFESWIPAGRIDSFKWSWVEHLGGNFSIIGGTEKFEEHAHSFDFPKPPGIADISQICLQIKGHHFAPSGHQASIAAGTSQVQEPEVATQFPSWWGPVTLPIWRPNLAATLPLREAIAGHVSVQPDVPGKEPLARNALVYFADWRAERPLDALRSALSRVRNESALMVIVVLPAGAFDSSGREIERRLPSTREGGRALVQFTEDDEGGWTRIFAVARTPSVYLINARREFVWTHEGEPDPAVLAAVLDQHLVPTRPPRFRPLRLTASPGNSAPDVSFEDDGRHRFALHRLRGREVLLNFWQSWSAPCLTELSRLQRLHQAAREPPFIVAFHGGNNSDALDEARKSLGLSFPLVQDTYQRIARHYGVRCWPTTITVGAEGRMQHIQYGIWHEHEPVPVRERSKPAEARA